MQVNIFILKKSLDQRQKILCSYYSEMLVGTIFAARHQIDYVQLSQCQNEITLLPFEIACQALIVELAQLMGVVANILRDFMITIQHFKIFRSIAVHRQKIHIFNQTATSLKVSTTISIFLISAPM